MTFDEHISRLTLVFKSLEQQCYATKLIGLATLCIARQFALREVVAGVPISRGELIN